MESGDNEVLLEKAGQNFEALPFEAGAFSVAKERPQKTNEDAFLNLPEHGLFAVIDGMGGYGGADLAAQTVKASLEQSAKDLVSTNTDPQDALEAAVRQANAEVLKLREENPAARESGTTLCLGQIRPSQSLTNLYELEIVNLGDSRAYTYQLGPGLTRLTTDDESYAERQNENPETTRLAQKRLDAVTTKEDFNALSGEDKFRLRTSNLISRGLGDESLDLGLAFSSYILQAEDIVLFVSDGVSDNLSFDEIEQIIKQHLEKGPLNTQQLSQELGRAAYQISQNPGPDRVRHKADDITAVAVSLSAPVEAKAEKAPQPSLEELEAKLVSATREQERQSTLMEILKHHPDAPGFSVEKPEEAEAPSKVEAVEPSEGIKEILDAVALDLGLSPTSQEAPQLNSENLPTWQQLEQAAERKQALEAQIKEREGEIATELAGVSPEGLEADAQYKEGIFSRLRSAILGKVEKLKQKNVYGLQAVELGQDLLKRAHHAKERSTTQSLSQMAKGQYKRLKSQSLAKFEQVKDLYQGHGHKPSQIETIRRSMRSANWDELIAAQEKLRYHHDTPKLAKSNLKEAQRDLRLLTIAELNEQFDAKLNSLLKNGGNRQFEEGIALVREYIQKRMQAGNASQEKARKFIANVLKAKFMGLREEDPQENLQKARLAALAGELTGILPEIKGKFKEVEDAQR